MKWVTWENVGIDRIGSAWLIRRFVDPAAEFIYEALYAQLGADLD
jgi:hypothetical protein